MDRVSVNECDRIVSAKLVIKNYVEFATFFKFISLCRIQCKDAFLEKKF